MDSTIVVAVISFLGTVIGTAGGIIASTKLTEYRLQQLEKKVDSLNGTVSKLAVLEEKITNSNRRIALFETDYQKSFYGEYN